MKEAIAALIGAIVAGFVAYFVSNRDLSNSLDSKSGWREKLFTVASTYELTLDHAQTVRAALRIFPQKEGDFEEYSFTWFSNIMINHLDNYILGNKQDSGLNKIAEKRTKIFSIPMLQMEELQEDKKLLIEFDTKIVRLFAMFLLKYHFDYRSSMGAKDYLFLANKNKNKKYNDLVVETFGEYIKMMQKEMQEEN